MKKIYILMLGLTLGLGAQAQINLTVTMDNHSNMDVTSDDPLDLSFTITNNGVALTEDDSIFVAVNIGTDYYTVSGLNAGQVNSYTITGGFPAAAQVAIPVDVMSGSWLTTAIGSSSGDVRVVCFGVGDSVLASGGIFSSETPANAVDNLEYVTWSDASGVADIDLSQITAFPNPATEVLNFNLGDNKIDIIQILDITGKIVDNIAVNNAVETLYLDKYQSGIYFYQVIKNNEVLMTEKVVVRK